MQGDIFCICWRCRTVDKLHEETRWGWLQIHWGHEARILEDTGDNEFIVVDLPVEETEDE